MSSEKVAETRKFPGFVLAEVFRIAKLPLDPDEPTAWFDVEIVARVTPAPAGETENADITNHGVLRPVEFMAGCAPASTGSTSDASAGFSSGPLSTDRGA